MNLSRRARGVAAFFWSGVDQVAATSRHADCFAVAVCYRAYARVAGSEQRSDHLPAATEELLAEPIHGVPVTVCRLMSHDSCGGCGLCGSCSCLRCCQLLAAVHRPRHEPTHVAAPHMHCVCSVRLCRQCGIDYSVRPRSNACMRSQQRFHVFHAVIMRMNTR